MRIASLQPFFVLSAMAVAACGGADTPAGTTAASHPGHAAPQTPAEAVKVEPDGRHDGHEAHAGPEGDHAHDFPGPVNDFHEVLGPIWHSEEQAVCGSEAEFLSTAAAVKNMKSPRGVQVGAWNTAVADLHASVEAMVAACSTDPAAATAQLSGVHDAFHRLVELIGHEEHKGR